MTIRDVPKITLTGATANSTAQTPPHIADTCACWGKEDIRRARRLLRCRGDIRCTDATAHAALISAALDMSLRGTLPKAQIVKAYKDREVIQI